MNNEIITEIPAIATAISSLAPGRGFLGQTTLETIRVYEWLNYLGGPVHVLAYGGLYRPERLVDDPRFHPAVRDKGVKNLRQSFTFIESKLAIAGTTYTVGNSFTVVDVYLFVLYRWARSFIAVIEMETDFPHLSALTTNVLGKEAVLSALNVHTGV